ncbi:M23 family metallopeptidase [Thiobacter aerophilum]|uniref:M23 family metallopeptidase n=1 Tax=Thiobacter aerophilum TaxID=3121275 RepID=A0ABV0EJ75_9BURK
MNIIIVSDRLARSRTICLGRRDMTLLVAVVLGGMVLFAFLFSYLILFHLGDVRIPFVQHLILSAHQAEAEKNRLYLQQSLNAMAIKVGEMQAQMLRLDALGERLARMAGVRQEEFQFDRKPGQGGNPSSLPAHPVSLGEFAAEIEKLSRQLDDRAERLAVMESALSRERVRQSALPSAPPVPGGFFTSNFGWRIDPFTGLRALHEGVDFMAPIGAPILAAAGGIVVYSDYHPGYGNMIEIDHGNGLVSRYAHASKRLVKEGDVVLRGQKIGEVGNTGRSTGPHLHFEVLNRGVPQNPTRYLQPAG